MKAWDEFLGWLTLVVVLIFICIVVSCCHSAPRCTMGLSDEGQALCCEIYCKDKGMEMKSKERAQTNPDEMRCICIQKENPDNSHPNKGPTGLF